MTCYVCNAISLGMFRYSGSIRWRPLEGDPRAYLAELAKSGGEIAHAIGHRDVAAIVGFPYRRESVEAEPGDSILVCQYRGRRLEEGATKLPEGATISWYVVDVSA
jgi:hypothetical protein